MSDNIPQTEMQENVNKEAAIIALTNALVGPADDYDPSLPLFLGTMKEEHEAIYKTAVAFLGWRDAASAGKEREANVLKDRFEELRDTHFEGVEEELLGNMLSNYFRFYFNGFDRGLVRNATADLTRERKVVNTIPLKNGQRLGLISAITPTVKSEMGVRERMRRTFLKASGSPDSFNVILTNSLIFLRVKIPTPLELVRLINDIVTKLHMYGERYNQTSIHLERAGISQILVDFILDRVSYHSVKGIDDPIELKNYIRSNDVNHLAQALLKITSPKGVTYRMNCLANKCGWSANSVIDPANMLLYVEEDQPEERRTLLFKLVNEGLKLSPEDLAANPPVYKDKDGNVLDTTVELTEGNGRLIIDVPYLSEYFQAYDEMAARINPELRELAVKFANPQVFDEKRREYLAQMRGHEYIQWFRSMEFDPPADSEGTKDVIQREENPKEFDEGLMDIFNKDEQMYYRALEKVITIAPRMTYTFVGICEDECPNCKEKSEGKDQDQLHNFTPIDPILNFFDHTRMMISIRTGQQSLQEDGLS